MSDSFLVAARIPMSRDGFERWLDTPVTDPAVIADQETVFDGWFWDGERADWSRAEIGLSPREFFADHVEDACDGGVTTCVVVHRDDALEIYSMCLGFLESFVLTALRMLAATAWFKSDPAPDTALFWAETGATLPDARGAGWLSVLTIGGEGARFTADADLKATIDGLRPAEALFFEMVDQLAEAEEDHDGVAPYHTVIPRDHAFVDPAILRDSITRS
ncbi:hypothetical protein [Nocardia aurea]|uniref:hypothetical protein n=1 Tax=Nocardia aurea TaxID=2144174 RepID=UPI00339DCF3A